MTHLSLFVAAVATFFALSAGQSAEAHDGINVEDAYARVSGETAKSAAVFMLLDNHSSEDDRLLSVKTDTAERAELHSHSEDANGVMSMGEVEDGFEIPGSQTHRLERSGDHIMLLGLKHGLKQGDLITLTLFFARGEQLTIDIVVDNDRKPGPAAHDMGNMTMPASE